MATTTENSSMFSLEMLTKQAPVRAAEPEEAPAVSLPNTFVPVLAVPAPVIEAQRPRVSGWVFVAAFVAFIAPVIAVVAVHETRTPAPKRVATTTATTTVGAITETSEKTETTPSATATQAASQQPAPCMCTPPPRPKPITTATATTATVKHEAPKCCPGETEMQCAMRRSVGAACG